MATVQEDILQSFYAKLAKSEAVDTAVIEALRVAFASGKKLKADDFVGILAKTPKDGTA